MKRVFITGASGFLGHELLHLAPPDVQILAQVHQSPLRLSLPNLQTTFIDFRKPDFRAVRSFRPEVILHAGAMTRIDECECDPAVAWQVNVAATQQLFDLSLQWGARFIFVSTDQVYRGDRGNYGETDAVAPVNLYGAQKVAAERDLAEHAGGNWVIARSALIYGKARHGRPTFTEQIIRKLRAGQPVAVFVDEFRTPIPVSDLAAALWELAENDFTGVINLGGCEKVTRHQMGEVICRELNLPAGLLLKTRMADVPLSAARPRDVSLNISRARSVLKTPLCTIAEGIRRAFGRETE